MKTIFLILALVMSTCSMMNFAAITASHKTQLRNFLTGVANPTGVVGSKYDKCLDDLEKSMNQAVETVRLLLDQNWNDALPAAEEAVKSVVDTVQCFSGVGVMQIKDRQQCALDHLQTAIADLKQTVSDVLAGNLDAAQKDLNDFVATLQDIQNC